MQATKRPPSTTSIVLLYLYMLPDIFAVDLVQLSTYTAGIFMYWSSICLTLVRNSANLIRLHPKCRLGLSFWWIEPRSNANECLLRINASKRPNTVQCAMSMRVRGIFQVAQNRPGTQVASCTVLEMIETYSRPQSVYYVRMWKRAYILASY
jgi:hypothetical protein